MTDFFKELDVGRSRYWLISLLIWGTGSWGLSSVSVLAEQGRYVPPSGEQSIDDMMKNNSNSYGLETLVAESRNNKIVGNSHSVLEDIGKEDSATAAARKALRTENRQLKSRIAALSAQLTNLQAVAQNSPELKSITERATSAEKRVDILTGKVNDVQQKLTTATSVIQGRDVELKQLQNQLAERDASLQSTNSKLVNSQSAVQKSDNELVSVKGQLADMTAQHKELEITLADARKQLKATSIKSTQKQVVPLDTPARQQAYVVGQAMAASLREKIVGYKSSGITLDISRIIAGLSDGLRDRMAMKSSEMDSAWLAFSGELQNRIAAKVKESEALVKKLIAGRKPAVSSDGLQFFVVKKGTLLKDKDSPRSLSLTERLAPEGKLISQVPQLTISPDDEMPPIVRNALPLIGPGTEVEVFALAQQIYEDRPLPKDVSPYSVLHYQIKGMQPQ